MSDNYISYYIGNWNWCEVVFSDNEYFDFLQENINEHRLGIGWYIIYPKRLLDKKYRVNPCIFIIDSIYMINCASKSIGPVSIIDIVRVMDNFCILYCLFTKGNLDFHYYPNGLASFDIL